MYGSAVLFIAVSALLADSTQAAWLHEGRVPVPLSEGHHKFGKFLRECYSIRLGNPPYSPPPKEIFSKVPSEWLTQQNQTLAAAAKKYEANFQSLAGDNAYRFYYDLCPYIETPPKFLNRWKDMDVSSICYKVRNNNFGNLSAPNTVWDPASQTFRLILYPGTNTTNSAGGLNSAEIDLWHRYGHELRKESKVLFVTLANITGTNYDDEMWNLATTEFRLAFKKSLIERLGQSWDDSTKKYFWTMYCSESDKERRRNKDKVEGNGNTISAAEEIIPRSTAALLISLVTACEGPRYEPASLSTCPESLRLE